MNAKGESLLKLVPALPEILRKGRVIESSADRRQRSDIGAIHKVSARVDLDGRPKDVVAIVRETQDGHFHYDLSRNNAAGARFSLPGQPMVRIGDEAQVRSPAFEGDADGELNVEILESHGNLHPAFAGDVAAIERGLKARLQKVGIADRVAVRLVERIQAHRPPKAAQVRRARGDMVQGMNPKYVAGDDPVAASERFYRMADAVEADF